MAFPKILATLVLIGAPSASAQTLHVSATLTTGANDGSSWADAYQGSAGLRSALAAATPGTEVWVTGGLYRPSSTGDQGASFDMATVDTVIRGGFLGSESTIFERPERGAAPTTLSGDLAGNDDGAMASGADNSDVVVTVRVGGVTLERLQIVGGSSPGPNFRGQAIFLRPSPGPFDRFLMKDCVVSQCFGFGVTTTTGAGGLTRARFEDCTFRDIGRAGVSLGPGELIVERCLAERCERGFYLRDSWSDTTAIRNTVIRDCAVAGIEFDVDVIFGPLPFATVQGCTIVDNGNGGVRQTGFAGSGSILVRNSIIQGHLVQITGRVDAEHSIIEGGSPGPGNLDLDPEFRDPAAGDDSLLPTSPAIDRGTAQGVNPGGIDVACRHRAVDFLPVPNVGLGTPDFVDIGAFEFSGTIGENGDCAAEPNATAAVQPGETWRFQLWHRDVPQGGVPTSQFTGLLSIAFD